MKNTPKVLRFAHNAPIPLLTGRAAYSVLCEAEAQYHEATSELAELRALLPEMAVAAFLGFNAEARSDFEENAARCALLEAFISALAPLALASINYENSEVRQPVADMQIDATPITLLLQQSGILSRADD